MDPPQFFPNSGAAVELPGRIPVMILENCSLFPHCLLPLNIFEPKYRQMLEDALGSHRMFCIGTVRPPTADNDPPDPDSQALPIYASSTAGLIRACVRKPDGTSRLVLQGLQRIQLRELDSAEHAYASASPVALFDTPSKGKETHRLSTQLRHAATLIAERRGSGAEQLGEFLARLDDPAALADIIAFHFIPDAHRRQPLLGIADVAQRLRIVLELLSSQDPGSMIV